jgi:hypothetical protein
MVGERSRRSSCFGEVAGPEARRLDKLAWSRRCAMLMGSACPWKLEHVCVTFWSGQGVLTILRSHLTAKVIDLAPTIVQAATGRRKFCCHDCCGLPYRNRELRPITCRLGFRSASPKSRGLPVESLLEWFEMIDPTPICPKEASGRCPGLACN